MCRNPRVAVSGCCRVAVVDAELLHSPLHYLTMVQASVALSRLSVIPLRSHVVFSASRSVAASRFVAGFQFSAVGARFTASRPVAGSWARSGARAGSNLWAARAATESGCPVLGVGIRG